MRAKNNLRLFQNERVAMLCNDSAAGKMVAQRLFQRFGYTLYSLTCAHNVHVFNLCQIIDGHSLLRVVIGLKPCIAHIQPVSLQMQQTAGVHVRVRRLQTVLHDIRHPYVKHTTKKYNSEKQKTQATKIVDLIAWGFCFRIVSYSKRSWTL